MSPVHLRIRADYERIAREIPARLRPFHLMIFL